MDVAEEMRPTDRQRYWLERIQACEAQCLSIFAYAAEHGFPIRAIYDAKKVLVSKGVLPRTQPARFQRVQTEAVMAGSEWHIQLPNGVSVDFSGTVDAGALTTILNTLASLG